MTHREGKINLDRETTREPNTTSTPKRLATLIDTTTTMTMSAPTTTTADATALARGLDRETGTDAISLRRPPRHLRSDIANKKAPKNSTISTHRATAADSTQAVGMQIARHRTP